MYAAIIPLLPGDRERIAAHLLRLAPEDRSLRFASALVTDDTVRRYVERMDFGRDLVMGLVSKRGQVIGLAHGCVFEAGGRRHVELAFSVDADWRGHGFGRRLMQAIVARVEAEAEPGRATVLIGSCAARNLPMRRVFAGAGMALTRDDDEFSARRLLAGAALAPAAVLRVAA